MTLANTFLLKSIALCFTALFLLSDMQAQQNEELKDIQQQIKQKQQQIEKQLEQAKRLQDQLKAAELNISNTAKALQETRYQLTENHQQQNALSEQQEKLKADVKNQQKALSGQFKSMYMSGDYDFAKMLFNMEEASNLERNFSYYQYLSQARKKQIDQFRAIVVELQQVNESLQVKQQELANLEDIQARQNTQLLQQQNMRKSTLQKIEQQIDTEAAQIEQLQINEQALLKAIEEAQKEAQQRPVSLSGLASLKGALLLPTQGRIRKMFGRIRQGQIRWKGVLFNGNTGAPVRAVHDGKILYADWLRGFGLMTVIDHGDGYMTLYGHNQALLKNVGDDVQSGETIALVGQSGGQSNPNLYFEMRHKGKPIDPAKWLNL